MLAFLAVALMLPAALQLAGRIGAAFELTGPLVEAAIAWKAFVGAISRRAIEFCLSWLDWHPSTNQVEGIALSVLLLTASGGPVLRARLLREHPLPAKDEPRWVDAAFVLGTAGTFISFGVPGFTQYIANIPPQAPVNAFGAAFSPALAVMIYTGAGALGGLLLGLAVLAEARRKVGATRAADERPLWGDVILTFVLIFCGTAVLFAYMPDASTIGEGMPRGTVVLSIAVPISVTAALMASAFLDGLAMARVSLGVLATLAGNFAYEFLAGVFG